MASEPTLLDKLTAHIPRGAGGIHVSVNHIESSLESFQVDLDPIYQRGHVWTEEQQRLFMGALILDPARIPPCILRRKTVSMKNTPVEIDSYEVLDGKQRITAVRRFRAGEIPFTLDGQSWFFEDLCGVDRRRMSMGTCLRWQFVHLPNDEDAIRYYLTLNTGGSVHTAEELDRVRKLLPA